MSRRGISSRIVLVTILGLFSNAGAREVTIEDFFRAPEFSQMKLSPSGEWVAALRSVNNRRNLVVLSVEDGEATAITDGRRSDIREFLWVSDARLVYTIGIDGEEVFGLFAIDHDGSDWRELVERTDGVEVFPRRVLPLDRLDDDPAHILVTDNERRKLYPDVFRLNVHSGRMTRVVRNPGYVSSWITDHRGVVRAGIGSTDDPRDLITRTVIRDSEKTDWRVLTEHHRFDEHGLTPVAFAADNKTLYVRSNIGRDTQALYTYDPVNGETEDLIFAHDEVDVGGLQLSPLDNRLLAVSYEHELPEVVAIDPAWAVLRKTVDAVLPHTFNTVVSMSDDERRLLILASSDTDPGSLYLLDRTNGQLRYYASRMSWLDPHALAKMQPITITARDGVTLHGYLTVPNGVESAALPLILHPHGGPYGVRDRWGFNAHVQFLASRGYAVLQVNFRGSGGYGKAFMDIAWGQWGLAMQDDLTDAVRWAVDEGIADPGRICIYGASYGGFAAMSAITRTPDLYRCAVSYAGIVDLPELFSYWSKSPLATGIEAWFERAIGDPREDRTRLEAVSPLNNLDGLDVPLFIVHGRRDARVPIAQTDRLTRALRRHAVEYELLLKNDEGHGFIDEENKVELYGRIEAFFAEHLDP